MFTINNKSGSSLIQSSGTQTVHASTENYKQIVPANLSKIFVSEVSISPIPSINTSTMVPFEPVNNGSTLSSEISISGTRSDLYIPVDLGHNGKREEKLSLHGGLKKPIWVTPNICTHQGINGEMCYMCKKDVNTSFENLEQRPDFTVLNVYGARRPVKKCKFGTITTLTTCFSVFVTVCILAFVVYDEVVMKPHNLISVHYKL